MADDEILIARLLVRSYSTEVDGRLPVGSNARTLARVLADDEEVAVDVMSPWRRFFEGVDDEQSASVIRNEARNLLDRWVALRGNSQRDDRLDLERYEPTVAGVIRFVENVNKQWQTKRQTSRRGRTMANFHKFCESLNSHRNMIKILPEGNEYVSIFTGTLTTIIGASVNHERIAEGFAEALCLISENIGDCQTDLYIYQTEKMMELVEQLYAHIFLYLSEVMKWLTKKSILRLLDSLKENFNETFTAYLEKIRNISQRIRDLARQSSHAEVRATRLGVEHIDQRFSNVERDIRIGLEGQARQEADLRTYAEVIAREMLEARRQRESQPQRQQDLLAEIKSMLHDKALVDIRNGHLRRSVTPVSTDRGIVNLASLSLTEATHTYLKDDIELYSAHLEDYYPSASVRPDAETYPAMRLTHTANDHLLEWCKGDKSSVPPLLWLEGTSIELEGPSNPLTVVATRFADAADRHHLPLLSYFCELERRVKLRPGETAEIHELTAMLYALIRQQVELLLPQFDGDCDLSRTRFERLDGTPASLTVAILLISDLMALIPQPSFWVLDGLHWLDDRSTTHYLKDLVDVLRASKARVLFTTTGRSGILGEELYTTETVVESERAEDAEGDELDLNITSQLGF